MQQNQAASQLKEAKHQEVETVSLIQRAGRAGLSQEINDEAIDDVAVAYTATATRRWLERDKCRKLLRAIEAIKDVLAADVEQAERDRTLPLASVQALRNAGLYGLKAPLEVGGLEADLSTQLAVFEAVSYISPSAGWNLFISAAGLGLAAAYLPDAALPKLFAQHPEPTFTSGGGYVLGSLVPVDGGYLLSGRWIYGSGIKHAEWSLVPAKVASNAGDAVEVRSCVILSSALTIHDTWHVVGLSGSGSFDYSVENLFVPECFTYQRELGAKRGGGIYRLDKLGFVTVEIAGFMLGVARRALDEIITISISKSRGYLKQSQMNAREVLQRSIGEADIKLKAVRALNLSLFEKAMEEVADGNMLSAGTEAELRAAGTMTSDITIEVANMAFKYAGGTGMRLDSPLQRCLRDLHAAGTHFLVSDVSYEIHGRELLSQEQLKPQVPAK